MNLTLCTYYIVCIYIHQATYVKEIIKVFWIDIIKVFWIDIFFINNNE